VKAYVKTFGCQMNEHDSERMRGLLRKVGYTLTPDEAEADFILINTCSIREKAEQKAFSHLGRLKLRKAKKPGLRIGVCGCIAQREGERIISRAPHVDLVFGTKNIHRLPQLIEKMIKTKRRVIEIYDDRERWQQFGCEIERDNPIRAWVTIMQGCNNYCTYCVVPYVRGSEWSRPAQEILAEIKDLAANGYKEVTLLGHNVNSYGRGLDQEINFPALLRAIDQIEGIERIRFTTSHPKDFSEELVEAIADCPKVCEHIHLPFQSGSDKILKSMNRNYTAAEYIDKVNMLRAKIPQAGITSDVIVGFPAEEEEDFQQTLRLIEEVQFEGLFTFLYSRRPQTAAGNFAQQVPNSIKQKRFEILLEIQNRISSERNESLVGTQQEVLIEEGKALDVDGTSGREYLLRGRTRLNKIVEFTGPPDQIGKLRQVKITKANRFNLEGIMLP